jgi:hypothetical protein
LLIEKKPEVENRMTCSLQEFPMVTMSYFYLCQMELLRARLEQLQAMGQSRVRESTAEVQKSIPNPTSNNTYI